MSLIQAPKTGREACASSAQILFSRVARYPFSGKELDAPRQETKIDSFDTTISHQNISLVSIAMSFRAQYQTTIYFSHNAMFVGLLFYIHARAHRHKGRKLRFQEAQRRRHTGSYYSYSHNSFTPPIYILNRCILSIYILNRYLYSICQPS